MNHADSGSEHVAAPWLTTAKRPREPVLAMGEGNVAQALARRILELDEQDFSNLRGAAGEDVLVLRTLKGPLPWVDGVQYFAACAEEFGTEQPEQPRLFLSTHLEPRFAPELLTAMLCRTHGQILPAILEGSGRVVPVGDLRPLSRERLEAWVSA